MSDKYQGGKTSQSFNSEAGVKAEENIGPAEDRDLGVSNTASQELYLKDKFSEEHDAIDERYREQTSRLAGQPLNTPTIGLGSDDPDTLHQRYEAILTNWSRDRERLATFEDYSTDRVRSEGSTLSGEFEASASQIGMPHGPEVANDLGEREQKSAQAEFARSAPSKGRSL